MGLVRTVPGKRQSGVAALTTLLGISVVIIVLGTALGFLAFFESAISASQMRSQEALLVAQAGISDSLLRLAQDKNFSSAGYTLTLGNGTATIIVTRNQPQTGQNLITSTGVVYNRQRKIEVKVAVDDTSGQVTIISWREISL